MPEKTIHEHARNHTNSSGGFVPFRVNSWIVLFHAFHNTNRVARFVIPSRWHEFRLECLMVLALILHLIEPAVAQRLGRNTANQNVPRVFLLDAKQLQETRSRIRAGDTSISAAWEKLEAEAQKALNAGPFSVVTKDPTPPSGTKHDYMSQAPYFWPDPNKPGGLPYIRR